jgi:two-component system, sensor histidine kinase and response regulator
MQRRKPWPGLINNIPDLSRIESGTLELTPGTGQHPRDLPPFGGISTQYLKNSHNYLYVLPPRIGCQRSRDMRKFSRESGTILIVDDEQASVQIVSSILAAAGYDLMIAATGEQALERVKARTPDLVLLDIILPDMSGFDVGRAIHGAKGAESVPIIFLSADNNKNTIVKALESGGVDYVTKPFSEAELIARVRSHLELKNTREECQGLLRKTERFLEIMAHDLRNWVGSANFSAHLIEEIGEIPDKGKRLALNIRESTSKALGFIDEYLANSREVHTALELHKRIFDLHALTRASLSSHLTEARAKQISIELHPEEAEIKVRSDRVAVLRIMENLITNAIKFSPQGSVIAVNITEDPVTFSVKDEGPGFSPEDRQRLFEPYTRLSARPTAGEISTGLGLSIVKRLCDQLDLEIEIETRGQGALIRLLFPGRSES